METLKLRRPEIGPEDRAAITDAGPNTWKDIARFVRRVNEDDYRFWDTIRHLNPPDGLTPTQAWFAVKLARSFDCLTAPIKHEDGTNFVWVKTEFIDRLCHELDMHTGGEIRATLKDLTSNERKMMVSRGLMDEAIASAQLEGADTAREYARRMLRGGVGPRNDSDRMILNNHRAMLEIEQSMREKPLSMGLIREMHTILTEGTLDDEGNVPTLRNDDRPLYVVDRTSGIIYHQAPSVGFMKAQLEKLIDYANNDEGRFTHPIIKATILHFWIGYLHPFMDGNGRLARLLFYWYLLRKEYWGFAYLAVAAKIKSGTKKNYTMAYVYSEQDDRDMTYFINYLLKKVNEAYLDFKKHVMEARKENNALAKSLRAKHGLNDRQISLIKYLVTRRENSSTIQSYQTISGVSRATAVNDLAGLLQKNLLKRKKIGRTVHYYASDALETTGENGVAR